MGSRDQLVSRWTLVAKRLFIHFMAIPITCVNDSFTKVKRRRSGPMNDSPKVATGCNAEAEGRGYRCLTITIHSRLLFTLYHEISYSLFQPCSHAINMSIGFDTKIKLYTYLSSSLLASAFA